MPYKRTFSVRYLGPTETKGSRFRVRWENYRGAKITAEVSYDYGAPDAFVRAIEDASGVRDWELRSEWRGNETRRVYRED